ncbi:MAG: hypothetical protein OEX03_01135 [Gammaproteobacteria bacterium]|nr:hypothetical protein [Gammaproteobacteria bacterium]
MLRTPPDYKVTSVEKTTSPLDTASSDVWYEYVISNEDSTITGKRCGSLTQVTSYANEYSEQLNERMNNGGSYYRPKKPVPAKT